MSCKGEIWGGKGAGNTREVVDNPDVTTGFPRKAGFDLDLGRQREGRTQGGLSFWDSLATDMRWARQERVCW